VSDDPTLAELEAAVDRTQERLGRAELGPNAEFRAALAEAEAAYEAYAQAELAAADAAEAAEPEPEAEA